MPTPADLNFDSLSGPLGTGSAAIHGLIFSSNDPALSLGVTAGRLEFGTTTQSTVLSLKTADGSQFRLEGFSITVDAPVFITFQAYRQGQFLSQGVVNMTVAGTQGFGVGAGTRWDWADEIRINVPSGITLGLDDLDFTDPTLPHSAPTISLLGGDVAGYIEGDAPVLIDDGANASVFDNDQALFDGGSLSIEITGGGVAAEDVLGIRTGSGVALSGPVANGTVVFVDSVAIGTVTSDGQSGAALTVTLNGNANAVRVNALLRNITYANINLDDPTGGQRTLTTTFSDADALSGDAVVQSLVDVSSPNDVPIIVTTSLAVNENAANASAVGSLVVNDVDSATLSYSLVAGAGDDDNALFAIDVGTGALTVADSLGIDFEQDDTLTIRVRVDDLDGGVVEQVITLDVNDIAPETVTGGAGDDTIIGGVGGDTIDGGAGDDLIRGGIGNDRLLGGKEDDVLSGMDGNDLLDGGAGDDLIRGGINDDRLLGGNGNDLLDGGAGRDILNGGAGNDILFGNTGSDLMTGGAGNDTFDIGVRSHSLNVAMDRITDFDRAGNDRIDLSSVFLGKLTYIHNAAFSAAGQVRIADVAGPDVIVWVNIYGTSGADFSIRLNGTTLASMGADDFIL